MFSSGQQQADNMMIARLARVWGRTVTSPLVTLLTIECPGPQLVVLFAQHEQLLARGELGSDAGQWRHGSRQGRLQAARYTHQAGCQQCGAAWTFWKEIVDLVMLYINSLCGSLTSLTQKTMSRAGQSQVHLSLDPSPVPQARKLSRKYSYRQHLKAIYTRFWTAPLPSLKGTTCREQEWHDCNRKVETFSTSKCLSDKRVDCFR